MTSTFADRRRDQAAAAYGTLMTRERQFGEIAVGTSQFYRAGTVIDLTPDAEVADGTAVVEVCDNGAGPDVFTVVHAGRTDSFRYESLDVALLHAVATRAGESKRADAAHYAARVLGLSV